MVIHGSCLRKPMAILVELPIPANCFFRKKIGQPVRDLNLGEETGFIRRNQRRIERYCIFYVFHWSGCRQLTVRNRRSEA